ncbi:hypothetical protein [Singulisphaera sp. PoT]|uniref:hypothetical protein n=1 Tax=Singulisphaera sp. PoT TaxID=3411797 RepID=UPI003BF4B3A0
MLLSMGTGCRSTRSEVPPGRPYSGDGRQAPPIGFSSDPRPLPNNAAGLTPGVIPNTSGKFGTPTPGDSGRYGIPTDGAYGPPGTSPLGAAPSGPGQVASPNLANPPSARPSFAGGADGPTPPAEPPSDDRPDPAQSPLGNYTP